MTTPVPVDAATDEGYAMRVADSAFEWYRRAAVRSRWGHRGSEVVIIVLSTLIPACAALAPRNTIAPAVLGSLIVVATGLRTLFHWQENYLRFSRARQAVEAERRLYRLRAAPYDAPATRDATLVGNVTRIEQDELSGWAEVMQRQPASQE